MTAERQPKKITPDTDVSAILEKVVADTKVDNLFLASDSTPTVFIPSGNIAVDYVFGGGIPEGRSIELFGQESSGKTTLAMCWIAKLQKSNEICALIDAEGTLDKVYATRLGVDMSKLIWQVPDSGEQGFEVIRSLIETGKVKMIVVDSVANMVPEAMMEGDMTDHNIGKQAKMMAQALRMITSKMKKYKTTVVFLNQLRDNIGVTFGETSITPGGKALKFYASVRLAMRRNQVLEDGKKRTIGNETEVMCKKNKVGYPRKKAMLEIYYNTGINEYSGLFDVAERLGIITNVKGRTYEFQGTEFTKGEFETNIAKKPEFIRKVFED